MDYHFAGPVSSAISDDGRYYLYYTYDSSPSNLVALGASRLIDMEWMSIDPLVQNQVSYQGGRIKITSAMAWAGTRAWSGNFNWFYGGNFEAAEASAIGYAVADISFTLPDTLASTDLLTPRDMGNGTTATVQPLSNRYYPIYGASEVTPEDGSAKNAVFLPLVAR